MKNNNCSSTFYFNFIHYNSHCFLQPCALTKLAQYSTQPYPTINSFEDIAYEENAFDFPEDLDVSLLIPDINMYIQEKDNNLIPITEPQSKTFNISCTPIRFESADHGNITASPPSVFSSRSPQLLSHLLDGNVPPYKTTSQILSPEQNKKPFLLPANLKPTGNTKMYRVRLPAGADSVQLPNSLVIRRLPDRRIVVCSGAAMQKDKNAVLSQPSVLPSNASPTAPTASSLNKPTLPCKIKLDSVPSLANRTVSELTSVQSCVKRTDLKKQHSKLPNNTQCNSSSNSQLCEKAPTMEVSEDVKKKLMGSIECLKLIFKRLDVHSLLK